MKISDRFGFVTHMYIRGFHLSMKGYLGIETNRRESEVIRTPVYECHETNNMDSGCSLVLGTNGSRDTDGTYSRGESPHDPRGGERWLHHHEFDSQKFGGAPGQRLVLAMFWVTVTPSPRPSPPKGRGR